MGFLLRFIAEQSRCFLTNTGIFGAQRSWYNGSGIYLDNDGVDYISKRDPLPLCAVSLK